MEREATEEMLRYTAEVCGKYREIKMLAEEAEAAWKQSLALMAESKYPSEKEMYEREAAEELEKYENKGVYISMDGFPASPMQIVAAHMTREEGSYMRDYILDTEGYIESLSFVNIKTKEQA